ncbi:hypothetical protein Pla22_52390 [Rubripirellula amarantea]|uniref:Uncharacterized protein n=1 Tax=Rubripirellula amarantea TaxID=2527999 RepID=A0A5C5WDU7_9BACT|nr:hypothetical protein [Rubripirellula amarantea]TWT47872.1 hypothetical protein Pla22_52390 [Rubripirellula amarantea]
METFDQIWESSRTNSLSWMYPAAVWCGAGILVALSVIKNRWLRRIGKLAAIFGFAILATEFSAQEIHEKWRLRREWADLHPAQMTEDGLQALTVDGANLTLGPLIYGFQAFLVFAGLAVVLSVLRVLLRSRSTDTMTDPSDQPTPPEIEAEVSDNPYHPPNVVT